VLLVSPGGSGLELALAWWSDFCGRASGPFQWLMARREARVRHGAWKRRATSWEPHQRAGCGSPGNVDVQKLERQLRNGPGWPQAPSDGWPRWSWRSLSRMADGPRTRATPAFGNQACARPSSAMLSQGVVGKRGEQHWSRAASCSCRIAGDGQTLEVRCGVHLRDAQTCATIGGLSQPA